MQPGSDRRGRIGFVWLATAAALAAALPVAWWGSPTAVAAVSGTLGMMIGYGVGVPAIRRLLARRSGIAGVAGAVVDEAVRMRSSLVLVLLLGACVPIMPLLLDPSERLAYRVQFLISWTLGAGSLFLCLLAACLACGSVCGDIASGRIQMTLAKPLHRWEYLVGKWLGIVLYGLLLVALVGVGVFTLVRILATGTAADAADRAAVAGQVLVARRSVQPSPADPAAYDAAIQAAIAQLEADDPDAFRAGPAAVRERVRRDYDRQRNTVTPDMVTTFVFPGVGTDGATANVQLEMEPRVTNVDVDLADVRFALWLNDRPWPSEGAEPREQTLPSRARHVFDLPADLVTTADDLRVRIANRNLVPPGETRPTAITFPPGNGLVVFVRTGSFEANLVRCLLIMWLKFAFVAAVGVAAGATFDLPSAILATVVIYAAAVGSEFFRDALGAYNVVGETAWGRTTERLSLALGSLRAGQGYEAFRMLLGFVTDGVLWLLPSFGSDAAIPSLATGITIPWSVVAVRGLLFGGLYPLLAGVVGWLILDRRDLVRT
jgi:hypothetical protein